MSTKSAIEWTNATWNPVVGCTLVSAGCTNCYAMSMSDRLERMGITKYESLTRNSGGRAVWTGVVREDESQLNVPLGFKNPRMIFVNSMSDLFHEAVKDSFIYKVWEVMEITPRHTYQILTKRPKRMSEMNLPVLKNVWLGTSEEDYTVTDRIDYLRSTKAQVRFISFEPLIGSVGDLNLINMNWAIVGGEWARPMSVEWVDDIQQACITQRVPFFFKQWSAWGQMVSCAIRS